MFVHMTAFPVFFNLTGSELKFSSVVFFFLTFVFSEKRVNKQISPQKNFSKLSNSGADVPVPLRMVLNNCGDLSSSFSAISRSTFQFGLRPSTFPSASHVLFKAQQLSVGFCAVCLKRKLN